MTCISALNKKNRIMTTNKKSKRIELRCGKKKMKARNLGTEKG
jgi:hypothetical protein